ncbi:DUF2125 domain-containing protein [Cereibacter sp. SYSU M97828]|nr:DUF2125 domain-containing protein [Cereibacter flavus]
MKFRQLAGGTAFITIAFSGAAMADLTPEQVWADWQAMSESWGQTMTADSTAREGDALIVSGVKLVSDQPGTRVEGSIERFTFTGKGDGTVEITSSETYPMTIVTDVPPTEEDPAPGPVTVKLNLVQSGMVMTASGEPGNTRYDYTIPMLGVTLDDIETDQGGDETVDLRVTANNVSGHYDLTGEARDMASTLAADNLVMLLNASNPTTGGTFAMNAELAGITSNSTATAMGTMVSGNMAQALRDGFASLAELQYESSTLGFDLAESGNTTKGSGTGGAGTLNVAMGEAGLSYGGSANDVQMEVESSQMPFPLSLAYDASSFDMLMPIVAGPDEQDWRLASRLEGFTLSDNVWSLFDPGAVLPRDPATLVLDLSGKATVDVDFMDPAQTETMTEAPGEFNSVDVNELHLNIAGADLTGQGGVTLDNTDLETFPGFPAPTGKFDLRLVGGNGLIDKAVEMGLVPQDQAMGARMMLGMFARMVEGETDTMTSTVEFKDKQLIVNGQRLQ